MRMAPPLFLLLAGLVAGCAEAPFVDQGTVVTVQKPINTVLRSGRVNVCHSENTPMSEITALAQEQCGARGLQALLRETQRWQCRANNPHMSVFRCVDPDLRDTDGSYLNPFNHAQVSAWERRTGKTAPNYGVLVNPVPAAAAPEPAPLPVIEGAPPKPPPAPISAVTPSLVPPSLSPADIAGKAPLPPAAPLPATLPPVRPLTAPVQPVPPPTTDFTLPVGSWSDHFKD